MHTHASRPSEDSGLRSLDPPAASKDFAAGSGFLAARTEVQEVAWNLKVARNSYAAQEASAGHHHRAGLASQARRGPLAGPVAAFEANGASRAPEAELPDCPARLPLRLRFESAHR